MTLRLNLIYFAGKNRAVLEYGASRGDGTTSTFLQRLEKRL